MSGAISTEDLHRTVYSYDRDERALVPWSVDPLPQGGTAFVEDLDGDGHPDALMVTGEGMRVHWGDAAGFFEAYSDLVVETGTSHDARTNFHLVDLDADGWLDLLMADDCGMVTLFRTGTRAWTHRSEALSGFETVDPYAIVTWPRVDRPSPIMSLGQPDCGFYSAFEPLEEDEEGYPVYEPVQIYEPNFGVVPEVDVSGLWQVAPMGAAAADLDRDGTLDLVVTLDPAHAILDGATPWPVASPMHASGLSLMDSDTEHPQLGWGVALVDLDKDGLDDVIVAHGDDTSRFLGADPSPGPQWATVHLNGGDFRFLDATEHLGMGRRGGWRAVTIGDLDGDADPDLIVGGLGEAPRVYLNDIETPNHSLAVRLVGRTSNRLGVGARVVVNPIGTDKQQLYAVGAMGSPKTVSSPMVYAGLGLAAGAHVTVTWPSGVVQVVEGLAAGQTHVIEEPEVLTIEPVGRHLTAGGEAVATLTVRPRSAASSVTATITHGDGIPGDAVEVDGVWTLVVAPPASPGHARIEVRIDGVPLAIRPRLWWDAP